MEEYEVRQRTIDVCRKASEWFLLPAEVTPGLIQELVLLPNTIATLEIVTEGAWCQGFNSKDAESSKAGLPLYTNISANRLTWSTSRSSGRPFSLRTLISITEHDTTTLTSAATVCGEIKI
jgi:hypothetical protein